jgi:hypothetical protein
LEEAIGIFNMSATKKDDLQVSSSDETGSGSELDSQPFKDRVKTKSDNDLTPPTLLDLATRETIRMESALGDAILRFFRIRKGPRGDQYDLDVMATQPSIWDSENIEEYKKLYIHPKWENASAFDPSFRWTFREENQVRRKVDWKIMVSLSQGTSKTSEHILTTHTRFGSVSCSQL